MFGEDTYTIVKYIPVYVDTCMGCEMSRTPAYMSITVATGLNSLFESLAFLGGQDDDKYGLIDYKVGEDFTPYDEGCIVLRNGVPLSIEEVSNLIEQNEYTDNNALTLIVKKEKYERQWGKRK